MIGVFDSGYGGLTVLKPLLNKYPNQNFLYLGDNARAPYGSHSRENVLRFTHESVDFLIRNGAKKVIIACNTASSIATEFLRKKYPDVLFFDVISPTVNYILRKGYKELAVVGTSLTIKSKAYDKELEKHGIQVHSKACPLLVPLIEEHWQNRKETKSILNHYLRTIKSSNPQAIILGCTHYPIVESHFKKILGKNIEVISSGMTIAEEIKHHLEEQTSPSLEFLTTDSPEKFQAFVERNFGLKIKKPKKVVLTPIQ